MSTSIVVAYPVTAEELAAQVDALRGLTFESPPNYKIGTAAIATCRGLRVKIEERRKLLKHDSLEYGKKVDAVAKQLTGIIEAVEDPLKAAKLAVDNEKERLKREAALAEQRVVEERIRAEREAEEAVLRQRRKAEEEQLAEQRRLLEEERKEAARERAALQAEREQAATELAQVRANKALAAQEQAAKDLAERLAAEAEEQRINALEYEQARQKRIAALAPDKDKLVQVGRALKRFIEDNGWTFDTREAEKTYADALDEIESIADRLENWQP